jgi:hypothetical protein
MAFTVTSKYKLADEQGEWTTYHDTTDEALAQLASYRDDPDNDSGSKTETFHIVQVGLITGSP